jgi:hypothetical protein
MKAMVWRVAGTIVRCTDVAWRDPHLSTVHLPAQAMNDLVYVYGHS